MKFESYIKRLDILAPDVTLTVGGHSGVKTILGSIFTLVAVGCFVASTVVSIQDFFSTSNPTVISQVSSSISYPPIDLDANYMIPRILPLSGTATPLPPTEVPRFATFLLNIVTTTVTIGADGSFLSAAKVKSYPYVPCALLAQAGKLDVPRLNRTMRGFVSLFLQVGICPDYPETSLKVSGRATDNEFVAMQFVVLPCSLPDQSQCAPKSQLRNFQFAYLTGQDSVNLGNFETPLEFSVSADELYYLDLGIVNRVLSRLMEIEIWDSKNILFAPDSLRTKYARVETQYTTPASRDPNKIACTPVEIAGGMCDPYFVRIVQSGGSKQTIMRSYKGLVETLGDVGGSRDTIFTIALFLYIFFNERSKKKYLLKEVYGIEAASKAKSAEHPKSSDHREELREKAFEHIESQLDVLAILKELNELKVLTGFLMTKEQRDQASLNSLSSLYTSEKQTKQSPNANRKQVIPIETSKATAISKTGPVQSKMFSKKAIGGSEQPKDWDLSEHSPGGRLTLVVHKLQQELSSHMAELLTAAEDPLALVLQTQPADAKEIATRPTGAVSLQAERWPDEDKPLK